MQNKPTLKHMLLSMYLTQVWTLIHQILAMGLFISFGTVLLCSQWKVSLQALNINIDNARLSSVPQYINVSVTTLSLKRNNITVIDNSSLGRYHKLRKLSLNINPLQDIKHGSFDNNSELVVFECTACKLHRLPVDFGPASKSLRYISLNWGIKKFYSIQPNATRSLNWFRFP